MAPQANCHVPSKRVTSFPGKWVCLLTGVGTTHWLCHLHMFPLDTHSKNGTLWNDTPKWIHWSSVLRQSNQVRQRIGPGYEKARRGTDWRTEPLPGTRSHGAAQYLLVTIGDVTVTIGVLSCFNSLVRNRWIPLARWNHSTHPGHLVFTQRAYDSGHEGPLRVG